MAPNGVPEAEIGEGVRPSSDRCDSEEVAEALDVGDEELEQQPRCQSTKRARGTANLPPEGDLTEYMMVQRVRFRDVDQLLRLAKDE